MEQRMTSRADIERVLADPRFEVPPVPAGDGGLAWLRATVSRFVNGADHARRRALVETEIDRLDPAALRFDAFRRTEAALDAAGEHIEAMTGVARPVPLSALAAGLGIEDTAAAAAAGVIVGPAYLSGAASVDIDAAVEELRGLAARGQEEATAAAIAVLAQACEATAALIGNAFLLAAEEPGLAGDTDVLLDAALRSVPPLLAQRRVAPSGAAVVLDLDAAGRDARPDDPPLTFGSGARPCPGVAQAVALAAGVLDALLPRSTPAPDPVDWTTGAPLRLAARLDLVVGAGLRP